MYTFILVCSLSNLLLNEHDDDDDDDDYTLSLVNTGMGDLSSGVYTTSVCNQAN